MFKKQPRIPEPQLEADPTVTQQPGMITGRIDYTEPEPAQPQLPRKAPKPKKPSNTWSNVLYNNDLTAEPWDNTVKAFDDILGKWQDHREQQQRQYIQNHVDLNRPIVDNKMSYEQQGRSPYDITISPFQAHQNNLVSPMFAPRLLSGHFLDGVQEQANGMSPRTLGSAFRDLKAHAGQTNQRLMDLINEGKKQAEEQYFKPLQRQYEKERQQAASKAQYYHGHPERMGEMLTEAADQAVKKTLRDQIMMRAEIGNALLFDSLDTNAINQWTAQQLGLDPNALEMQMMRPLAYGTGVIGSLAIPVGGMFKGAHLGYKATKGFHLAARAGQAYQHIPKPAKTFLKDVSLAGLQGFIANPNLADHDNKDFLNWDTRVQNAMAAMLLAGGGQGIGKVRELLSEKGRKLFHGTDLNNDFNIDPFHTADAQKTLSSSMGFSPGGGGKGGKGEYVSTRAKDQFVTAGHTLPSRIYWRGADKIDKVVKKRGWDYGLICHTIENPFKIEKVRDVRRHKGMTEHTIDQGPVTRYYIDEHHFVALRDDTGSIVQITNRNDSSWTSLDFSNINLNTLEE